ncbi:hypothetical protein H6770_01010 [Candidatus Peribacteria bacterium]|nr:hypothetical protein [Candidatus Peribacteria bacterium]
MVTFSIAVPRGSERSPRHVEHLLVACGVVLKRGTVSLGYRCLRSQVTLTLTAAKDDASRLRSQLADAFPDATITQLDDAIDTTGNKACAYVAKVWLQPEIFSLKCHSDFEDRMARTLTDPVAQILSVMQGGGSDSVDIDNCGLSCCRVANCS